MRSWNPGATTLDPVDEDTSVDGEVFVKASDGIDLTNGKRVIGKQTLFSD